MRARRTKLLAVLALVVAAMMPLTLLPPSANADSHDDVYTPDPDAPTSDASVSVDSGPDGVTIYIAVSETSPGSSSDSSSGSTTGGSGWSCTADVMNIGHATREWFEQEAPLHPGELPWIVRCDNGYFAVVWLPVDTAPADIEIVVIQGDSVDPATVAAELLDHVPVPNIIIGVNPTTGLVAVPSWFWIEGYGGAPIVASDTLGDVTVDVEITPTGYRWSFGDGATLDTTSMGQAYPRESDIRHSYEQSSLSVGGSFAVTVEITFSARYRVNGGAWEPLDPITRSFTSAYPVQQLQSILTGQ